MKREVIPGRVSVIVPCYNSAPYIVQCLDSLISQTYPDIEIIIVEDGSLDSTWIAIQRWKSSLVIRDIRFNLNENCCELKLPRNIGYAGAVTTGMFLAQGEFIAMQDSDDISHPNRIERQVSVLRERAELGVVGTSYEYFKDGQLDSRKQEHWLKFGKDNITKAYKNGLHCVCHGTILFRAAVFDKLGGPTRRLEGVEDYDFIARCVVANIMIDNLKESLYYYRLHDNQRSHHYFS